VGASVCVRGAMRSFHSGIETIRAVDGVDLDVPFGQMICIYGASGSGKSRLLNLIAGLDVPDEGEIAIGDLTLTGMSDRQRARVRLERVGVVFQENNLIDEFTGGENVFIPLLAAGLPMPMARSAAEDALGSVGIGDLFDRRPGQMSGGQRQRVGIARALAGSRIVLVADEPTGALDSATSAALFELVASLCHERGVTALVATHDPLARDYADSVLTMRDGRVRVAT
jgi:putative ABC transport system ATP-binding protein